MKTNPTQSDAGTLAGDAKFVRSLARRLLRDPGGAEDLSQQVLLTALERPPRGVEAERRGWLARVTRNLAARRHREATRRLGREQRAARAERVDSTADVVERFETRQRVAEAVRVLREPYRTVILLRFFDGLPRRAIAKRLGVPAATVTSRLQRGLALLRRQLDQEYGERDSWCRALAPLAIGPGSWVALESVAERGIDRALSAVQHAYKGVTAMSPWTKLAIIACLFGAGAIVVWQAGPSGNHSNGRTAASQDVTDASRHQGPSPEVRRTPVTPDDGGAAPDGFTRLGVGTGGTVTVHVVLEDGSPVEGVGVRLMQHDLAEPLLDIREQISGGDGSCLFEAVPEGGVMVFLNPQLDWPSSSQRGDVVAGEDLEITAVLAEGVTVTGTVVDLGGTPVAGATVWAGGGQSGGEPLGPLCGQAIAATSVDGSFTLNHMNPGQLLAAWVDGLCPSRRVLIKSVMEGGADPVEMQLQLGGPGGGLQGVVTDGAGVPVAGAVVCFGRVLADYQVAEDGEMSLEAPARRLVTDETGSFRADGLAPGPLPVAARAAGYGLWRQEVEIVAGGTVQVNPVLDQGATLGGRVTTEDGKPVPDTMIWMQPDRQGDDGWEVSFDLIDYRSRTDAAGEFTLEHVPAGRVVLTVQASRNHVFYNLLTRTGETTWCDAVLAEGLSMSGRVTDENDQPWEDWCVVAFDQDWQNDPGYLMPITAVSDAQGRFTCEHAKPGLYTVLFWSHVGNPVDIPVWVVEDVDSRTLDLTYRIPHDALPSARVTGFILQADGSPPPPVAMVVIKRSGAEWGAASVPIDPETGRFESDLLPPVTCQIEVFMNWDTRPDLGLHHLAPGETLDLGTVYLPE